MTRPYASALVVALLTPIACAPATSEVDAGGRAPRRDGGGADSGTTRPELDAGPAVGCGDTVCDGSESCESCAADCGTCPPPTDHCLLPGAAQVGAPWPVATVGVHAGFSQTRCGRSTYRGPRAPSVLWSRTIGPEDPDRAAITIHSPAVAADGTVYVMTADGLTSTTPSGVERAPPRTDVVTTIWGSVLVIDSDGEVQTGPADETYLGGVSNAEPSFVLAPPPTSIHYRVGHDRLTGTQPSTGARWSVPPPSGSFVRGIVSDIDGYVLACYATNYRLRVSPAGDVESIAGCATAVGPQGDSYQVAGEGGASAFATIARIGRDGRYLYDRGSLSPRFGVDAFRGMGVDPDGGVVVASRSGDSFRVALHDSSGVQRITSPPIEEPSGPPAIDADGIVYVSTIVGKLYAFRRSATAFEELFSLGITGRPISAPAIGTSGRVYVASSGTLFAIGDSLTCEPSCVERECGSDGCEGSCGTCEHGTCENFRCACTPDCRTRTCGSDGCGGSCGECTRSQFCAVGYCGCGPEGHWCERGGSCCEGLSCDGITNTCARPTRCLAGDTMCRHTSGATICCPSHCTCSPLGCGC